MIINSEQEMLEFGKDFVDYMTSTGGRAGETPNARSRKANTMEETARSRPVEPIVIELIGDVGAGKTTLTRGFAKGLDIKEPITSPSFTISKSYALKNGGRLIHYDFYRLPDPGIMLEDLQENLTNPKNIIIVEWSDSVRNILPKNHIKLFINKLNNGSREIKVKDDQNNTFRDRTRLTRSRISEASPVTTEQRSERKSSLLDFPNKAVPSHETQTGRSERVEKGVIWLSMYLDTSTPETILKLNEQEYRYTFANDLTEKLLKFIHDKLQENNQAFQDISEITFMSGPGSFTGLRIGATIVNTLASELNIPLYDHHGKKHQLILPDYGRPANISKPRK